MSRNCSVIKSSKVCSCLTVERKILTKFMASSSLDTRQIRMFFTRLVFQKRTLDRRQVVTSRGWGTVTTTHARFATYIINACASREAQFELGTRKVIFTPLKTRVWIEGASSGRPKDYPPRERPGKLNGKSVAR